MIEKARGYNAIYLPWAPFGFPNNLQPTRGAAPLTFDELGAQLAANGANTLRVKFCGWHRPLGSSAPAFELTLGKFTDWGGFTRSRSIARSGCVQMPGRVTPGTAETAGF
jgi:hypothetical protein